MSDMTIDEATADTTVTGVEKIPVSDGGAPKSMTVGQINDFVLGKIAEIAAANAVGIDDDSVYILRGGAMKPVSASVLAAAIMAEAFGRASVTSPNGNEVLAVKDSASRKTITLASVKTWLEANMAVTPDLTLSDVANAGALGDSDVTLVVQATAGKKVTIGTLKNYVLGKLAEYVTSATSVQSVTQSDIIYIVQGGNTRKITVAKLIEGISAGDVTAPSEHVAGNIPAWDNASKKLTSGYGVATTLSSNNASADKLPTEAAVRTAIDALGQGVGNVQKSGTPESGSLARWNAEGKIEGGPSVVTRIGETGADTNVPTEKAVRDAIAGAAGVTPPSLPVTGNVPVWGAGNGLTSGMGVATEIRADLIASDDKVPTEKAVRTAIDAAGNLRLAGTPTNGSLAQFNEDGEVKSGPGVVTAIGETGRDDNVPTEKAVRAAIAASGGIGVSGLPTSGFVPVWGGTSTLTAGKAVAETIRDTTSASHGSLPTEKAVSLAIDGLVKMPSSHTENAIPQWGNGSELKAGLSLVTSSTGIASADNASESKVPTEKAVRAALPVPATTAADGLMSAADKAKLDGMVDTSAVQEIGDTPLADADAMTVLQGGTTWKKALMTRFWNYIKGKLSTFKIDDLAAGEDNTDLDTSATRHGLCPKLSGDTTQFLRGDGVFATPEGSEAFDGDAGDGGSAGLVPAPAGGDAAANKFLCANGTWAVPPSAAGVDIPGSTAIDAAAAADELICYDVSENAFRKVSLAQVLALAEEKVRYDSIFIPAGAMIPGATAPAMAGAVTFTNAKHDTMAFNATASQTAEFDLVLPDGWDGGALKAKFLWTAYDSTKAEQGEGVKWQIGCTATPGEGAITVAPTAWADKTDTLSQVNELHRTTATAAFTPEGTIETGGLLHFTVKRDNSDGAVSGAPLDTDALLLGVLIQYGKTEGVAQW